MALPFAGAAMKTVIDIGDLPAEQAKFIQEFVAFLRARSKHVVPSKGQTTLKNPNFAMWTLGVKGPLTRDEIYDHL
jgi:hypothetical protein